MTAMFFGQYLLAKGVIDREALLDALDRQRESNLSLPDLAIQQGLIDRQRADAVMQQYRLSDRSIEDILIATGGLDTEQVERLQHKQRSSWLRIGAALAEGGHLTEEAIASNLEDYRSLEGATDQKIHEAMRHLPNAGPVSVCVELTVFHFSRVAGRPAKLKSVSVESDDFDNNLQRFSQRIHGDGDFTIAVDLPPVLIAAVAQGMLGFDVGSGTETEADAVCEVVNLIGGNACTRIEQFGNLLRPEPPIWSGTGTIVSPFDQVVRVSVVSEDVDFDIRIFSAAVGEA